MTDNPLSITIHPPLQGPPVAPAEVVGGLFGADGLSFKDILDVINPFQQLPIISTLYRAASGDTISTASRLVGGTLLGGPIGFAVALVNSIIEGATGHDVGSSVLAAIDDKMGEPPPVPFEPEPTSGAARMGNYSAYVRAQSLFT